MRYNLLLLAIVSIILFSCKKETSTNTNTQTPPPPPPPPSLVLLKEINIPNLPSPYYHFEYTADKKVSFVSFASDLKRYDVSYEGSKISAMDNNSLGIHEKLQYFYDNAGKVTAVNAFDATGALDIKYFFTYNREKLVKLERQRKLRNDFVLNKTLTFTYYADGNLQQVTDHRPVINGQQVESTSTLAFEQYDDKVNADGFSIIHNDFFDHLVLLPNVQLQKNNPRKEIRTGDGMNYEVNYTYTYNNVAPLTKIGAGTITSGTDAGNTFQTQSVYTYY